MQPVRLCSRTRDSSAYSIALLLADDEEPERAAELYALCRPEGAFDNNAWKTDAAGRELAAIIAALRTDVAAAALERGRTFEVQPTMRGLLTELEAGGWREETGD